MESYSLGNIPTKNKEKLNSLMREIEGFSFDELDSFDLDE